MAKNKILITSKLIGSLILSFSVNECWFVVCKQKAEVLYAFRKRKLLHSLDKAKLCPHWSHAHLTVSSQIHDKPPANIYCILETHATTCSTWPAPGHTVSSVSIAGCVNHAGRAGWKAARSLPHLQPFPQSSALLSRSLFVTPKCVRVAMLMWWSGDHQLRFKEVPGPDRLVSFQPDGFVAPGYSADPVKVKFSKLMGY